MVVIAHRLSTIANADTILVMKGADNRTWKSSGTDLNRFCLQVYVGKAECEIGLISVIFFVTKSKHLF